MSFFGFDTGLPAGDKAAVLASKDEERALNDKIERALASGAQEDVEVYTWGQDGYDGLGDQLEETNDEVNEDTFGAFAEDVGKDFDFGYGASAPVPGPAPAHAPKSDRNASAFAASLDDFWDTPSISRRAQVQPASTSAASGSPMPSVSGAGAPRPKSLEEVEAELRAQRVAAAQQPAAMPPPASAAMDTTSRPLTLGEVEAELLKQRRAAAAAASAAGTSAPPAQPQQAQSSTLPPMQVPPGVVPPPSMLPPRGMMPPPHAGGAPGGAPMVPPGIPPPGVRPVSGGPMPVPPGLRPTGVPPTGAAGVPAMPPPPSQAAAAEAQAAHLARMRSMLEACPPSVQKAILSLPPPIQFDSLEDVAQKFSSLLRGDTNEADAATQYLTSSAPARMDAWKKAEDRRRAKASKLADMMKYNGVMSGADKDFITRIQISHLVTSDPYTDDFYAHVFFAVRGGARKVVVPDGSVEAIQQHKNAETSGKTTRRKLTRHENAMLRMQQQVERLVDNRKKREAKSQESSLSGALGRVSLVSATKPRQMLQLINQPREGGSGENAPVAPDSQDQADAMRMALKGAALGDAARAPQSATRKALTRRESLAVLERLYHMVLRLEQLRRDPATSDSAEQAQLTASLWEELRVLEPLGVSDPHPFVSLLNHVKGKRLLPRILRLLNAEQALTVLTMLVASFESLDAVRDYPLWEKQRTTQAMRHMRTPLTTQQFADVSRSIDAFANSVLFQMMALINNLSLRIISGMLALLMERNQVLRVAQTRPGVSLLSALLSRAEALQQQQAPNAVPPAADELEQWHNVLGVLLNRLSADGQLPSLFYSTRAKTYMPFGVDFHAAGGIAANAPDSHVEDEPVWNLMALLAIHSDLTQQQVLVQELRDKILSNILAAKESAPGGALPEDVRIRNVNLLLHALNLDAAQITL